MNRSQSKIRHIQETNRILEQRRTFLKEQVNSNVTDQATKMTEFISLFKGKAINFYLPNDTSLPILPQVYITNVRFDENGNTIIFNGNSIEVGDLELNYTCDGSDIFSVNIRKFKNDFLNKAAQGFDVGINNQWKTTLLGYVEKKMRTINKIGKDLTKDKTNMINDLTTKYPRPLVQGGTDPNGKEMIKYIQDYLCSINKAGKAVPKAAFASTENQLNQNLS